MSAPAAPRLRAKSSKKEPKLSLNAKLISIQGSPSSSGKIVREDSHCGLLENSCDDLSEDLDDDYDDQVVTDDDQMEYYFDGETIIQAYCCALSVSRIVF